MREFRIKVNNEKTYVVKANDYNQAVKTLHSKLRDFDLTNFLALKRSLELRIGEEIDFDKLEEYVNKLPKDKNGKKNINVKEVIKCCVKAKDNAVSDSISRYTGEDAIRTNGFVKIKEDGDWTSYRYNGSDFDGAVFKIHQYNPSLIAFVSNGNRTITVRNKYLNDADDTAQGEIEVLKSFGFDYKDGKWVKESNNNNIIVQPDYHYVSVIGPDDTEKHCKKYQYQSAGMLKKIIASNIKDSSITDTDMKTAEDIIKKYGGNPVGNVMGLQKTRFVGQDEIKNQHDFATDLDKAGYKFYLINGRYRISPKDSSIKDDLTQVETYKKSIIYIDDNGYYYHTPIGGRGAKAYRDNTKDINIVKKRIDKDYSFLYDSSIKDVDWDFANKLKQHSQEEIRNALKYSAPTVYKQYRNGETIQFAGLAGQLTGPEKTKVLKRLGDSSIKDVSYISGKNLKIGQKIVEDGEVLEVIDIKETQRGVNNNYRDVTLKNVKTGATETVHFGNSTLARLNDDWSKGVSVTVKVTTESLINAAKEHKVLLGGRNDAPEKFIGRTSIRFTLPNKDNTAYANIDNSQSTIHYNMYDDEFTYKEFGGKKDFNKAKLTEGLKKLQDYVVSQLISAGIVVNQSKVEVGGSSRFNSTWRQAQSYNDESVKDADPVKVEKIIRKEKSALGITYYLFQTKSNSGATIYYEVTDKSYHGEPTYSGGGVISFSLQSANDSLDSHLLYDKLVSKYGKMAGRKRFFLGKNDSVQRENDASTGYKYRITNNGSKWYYETTFPDGHTTLTGPYSSKQETEQYFHKHRPTERLNDYSPKYNKGQKIQTSAGIHEIIGYDPVRPDVHTNRIEYSYRLKTPNGTYTNMPDWQLEKLVKLGRYKLIDSNISDTKFLVHAYNDGKLLEEKLVNTKVEAEQLAKEFTKKYGEDTTSIKLVYSNITDADPVKVEKIIRKEKSALGITYYIFQTKSSSGYTIYYQVTDKTYHGEPTYSGGGIISLSLKSANDTLDHNLLSDKLKAKYGEKEGTKRYLRGENDSAIKDKLSTSDANSLVEAYIDKYKYTHSNLPYVNKPKIKIFNSPEEFRDKFLSSYRGYSIYAGGLLNYNGYVVKLFTSAKDGKIESPSADNIFTIFPTTTIKDSNNIKNRKSYTIKVGDKQYKIFAESEEEAVDKYIKSKKQ